MDTKIKTVDPFLPHYIYEKTVNPAARLVWKQYEKKMVDRVDRIIELAHGQRETVSSLKDWEVVQELFTFFAEEWPEEYKEFMIVIPDIRRSRRAGGYSETREIKYVGALPPRFARMIRAIFPTQQFDKRFVNKLVQKLSVLKVGGENNMSKGGVLL